MTTYLNGVFAWDLAWGYCNHSVARILSPVKSFKIINKNSSGDEIANVNFYAVRPGATRIR